MAPKEGSQEPSSTPDTVEKGMATINTLRYTKRLSPKEEGPDDDDDDDDVVVVLHFSR